MSQLDSKTKQIGNHKFEVFKLDPLDAQDILIDLGQALAPALGKTVAGAAKVADGSDVESLLDVDIEDPKVSSAITAFFKGLDKAMLRDLILRLAKVTHCDGAKLGDTYRVVFRGDLPLMYEWLWFALGANFGNFFGWAGGAISGVTGIVKAARSQSTSGDTGQP